MDCNLPGSSAHGIFQTRILEWVAISSFRGSFRSRNWTCICCTAGGFFTARDIGEALIPALERHIFADFSLAPDKLPASWKMSLTCHFVFVVQSLSCVQFFAMNCSTPASLSITNSQSFLKLVSIKPVMPSNYLILCWPLSSCLQSFPASGYFPMSQFFTSDGQCIAASVSASVLPMTIQDWFPLGLTGWISLQSKGLSRVFSNTAVQKHQFSALSFLYGPTPTSLHNYWKNHSFD